MMIEIGRAAKLIGLRRDAIYKMIKKSTIPFEQKVAFGRSAYRIPKASFLLWLKKELGRVEERVLALQKAHRIIEREIENGRSA